MKISPEDLLAWMVIKDKICLLEKEAQETADGITALQRCHDDFGNIAVTTFEYQKNNAAHELKQISYEIKELQKTKEAIEARIKWRIK